MVSQPPPSAGALLAWIQGCILVPWTASSLTGSCADLELRSAGQEGWVPLKAGRRVVAECGKWSMGGPSAQKPQEP